jgi:hypothetical protein
MIVSFTLRLLYPWIKSLRYPFDRRLGASEAVRAMWRIENS